MRIGGHQTFQIRESWIFKGLYALSTNPMFFNEDEASEALGIGKNMAESLVYWLQALQLAKKGEGQELTPSACLIFEQDPYLDYDGTLWLLHYLLATNSQQATAWHWFFNKFGLTDFDMDSLFIYFSSYLESHYKKKISDQMLKRELSCLLKTYDRPDYSHRATPETENPSPFSRLGLINQSQGKYHKTTWQNAEAIDPLIYIYCLYIFWASYCHRPASLSIDEIIKQDKSPSLVFSLGEAGTYAILERISQEYGDQYLGQNKSGGYFIVNIHEKTAKDTLTDYYKKISKQLRGK